MFVKGSSQFVISRQSNRARINKSNRAELELAITQFKKINSARMYMDPACMYRLGTLTTQMEIEFSNINCAQARFS